jgi:uncharacterized phage-associated protein
MLGPFRSEKLIQATAVLLKTTDPRRMSRLRLLKLLYIADRECIRESGRSITGDRAVAMDHGPVLSRTYACIKGQNYTATSWEQFFRRSGKHDVELHADPGIGKLSQYEIRTLQSVAERFEELDDWSLSEHTHTFPEWLRNRPEPGSSRHISVHDVLEAVGRAEDAEELIAEAAGYADVDRLLARTPLA